MFKNNYLNIKLIARHISHIVHVSENECAVQTFDIIS